MRIGFALPSRTRCGSLTTMTVQKLHSTLLPDCSQKPKYRHNYPQCDPSNRNAPIRHTVAADTIAPRKSSYHETRSSVSVEVAAQRSCMIAHLLLSSGVSKGDSVCCLDQQFSSDRNTNRIYRDSHSIELTFYFPPVCLSTFTWLLPTTGPGGQI